MAYNVYIYIHMYNILTFFRAILWHSIWLIFSHYLAVFLALYLTSILTFFLAYILTFFLELYLTYVLIFYLAVFLASILTFYVPVQAWPHPELETLTWVGKNIFESVKSRVPGYIHVHPCTSIPAQIPSFIHTSTSNLPTYGQKAQQGARRKLQQETHISTARLPCRK